MGKCMCKHFPRSKTTANKALPITRPLSTLPASFISRFPCFLLSYLDCAVCAEGYSSGITFSCHECTGANGQLSIGVAAVISFLLILIVSVMISDLARAGDDSIDGQARGSCTRSSWTRRVRSCRDNFVEAVPLPAIKIVVVVWQIVTQVCVVISMHLVHALYVRFRMLCWLQTQQEPFTGFG